MLQQIFFGIFKVPSRQLVGSPAIVPLHPEQHWFKGNFSKVLEEVFLDDTNTCDTVFDRV